MFHDTGKRAVAVSFEKSHYFVKESSGLITINIVTSDRYKSSFTAKLSVQLGKYQKTGDYGKTDEECALVT